MLIDLFDTHEENPDDFVSFIMFEPSSLRVPDNDILLMGDDVANLFESVMASDHFTKNIQDQILLNRLTRIEMMVDLLRDNSGLVLTKFLNNIWRRYSFFSNLGELFVTQKDLKRLVPDFSFKIDPILDRIVESDDTSDSDDDSGDDSDDASNESKNTVEQDTKKN